MERSGGVFTSVGSSGASATRDREVNWTPSHVQDEESDEEDAFISFTTTESKCETLFQRGLELKIDGELEQALTCFQDCLEGMQDCQYFAKLPQTLQQLEYLYRRFGHDDKADEYVRAEKLFQEATQLQLDTPLEGARTKRKPFSKKSARSLAASNQICNPGEYGNLMIKKAEEFDKLARFCTEKGEIELALDYCGKMMILRQCVYGGSLSLAEASLNHFGSLYAELEVEKGTTSKPMGEIAVNNEPPIMKGDLSTAPSIDLCAIDVSGINGGVQSANCGCAQENMWSTGADTLYQSNSEINSLQTESLISAATIMENCREHLECPGVTESHKFHAFPGANGRTKQGGIPDFPNDSFSSSAQECRGDHNILPSSNRQEVPQMTIKDSPRHFLLAVQPQNHHQGNLCTGMKNNLTKLTKLSAELKAPMCVTLDVQAVRPGAGMEHPRCLPLWVLLLGAFVEMALLGYMLYYH